MSPKTLNEIPASDSAKRLMRDSLVWDNHVCLPLRKDDHTFLPQLAGLKALGYNLVTVNIGFDVTPWENAVQVLATMRQWLKAHSEDYLLISSSDDIREAQQSGRLGVLFDIEGGTILNGHIPMIQLYYDLGVRWMLLAYNKNNELAGGCQDNNMGITARGRDVVAEMERVGMVVCCSHTSQRSAMDIMEMATKPVIFSHSNIASLHTHCRNISDEAITACANTGGVVGITGVGIFMGDNNASSLLMAEHIDYAVQLVGPQHVSLGTDFTFDRQEMLDFVHQNPETFDPKLFGNGIEIATPDQLTEVVDLLLQKNYRESDIKLILGENLKRIAATVWK